MDLLPLLRHVFTPVVFTFPIHREPFVLYEPSKRRIPQLPKRMFPFLATKDVSQTWSKEWFYSEVSKESRITYNRNAPPEWSSKNRVADKDIKLSNDEKRVVLVINNLVERGLTRRKIVHDFLKNKIFPSKRGKYYLAIMMFLKIVTTYLSFYSN